MQEPQADNQGPALQPQTVDLPSEGSSHTFNPTPDIPGTPDEPWGQQYLLTLGMLLLAATESTFC